MENSTSPASPSFFRRAILPRLIFLLLLFPVFWAYRPAQTRFFSSDQLLYFAELDGDRSISAGLRLLDYSAERKLTKGDELLYRPLLMAGLAIQNSLFQLNYRAWNLANLFCHFFVCWLLFEALWLLRRSSLAHAFAIWFALLSTNYELVTWNHLGGYMLGYGFLLIAIVAARHAISGNCSKAWWIYSISIFSAMLFHEIAVLAAIIAIPCARRFRHPPSPGSKNILFAPLILPLAIYLFLYAFHVAHCERWLWTDSSSPSLSIFSLPLRMALTAWLWTTRILFPAAVAYTLQPLDRTLWNTPQDMLAQLAIAGQFILCAALAFWLRLGITRLRLRQEAFFLSWIALLLAAYIAMNWMGRTYVLGVPYYAYFFALFGILFVYSLLDLSRVGHTPRMLAIGVLAILAALNAHKINQTSLESKKLHAPFERYFGSVAQTVSPRLQDPLFTFGIRNPPPQIDMRFKEIVGYADTGIPRIRHVSQMLYGYRYSNIMPSLWLDASLPESPP